MKENRSQSMVQTPQSSVKDTSDAEHIAPLKSAVVQAKVADEEEGKRKPKFHRWKLVAALFLPTALAQVDTMIVAPAMPSIASHFGMFLSRERALFANV
jgi:hypothetical protein